MTEIILDLAALLLALFCLIYSVRRRAVVFPLPKGMTALLKSRRALYLAMLAALAICAAAELGEGAALALGADARALSGFGIMHLILQIALLIIFILYAATLLKPGEARGGDAAAVLPLAAVAAVGVALRAIWNIRVDLFFEAVALFGGMALVERGDDPRGEDRRFRGGVTLAVALTLLAVIATNVALILNLSRAQSDEIGNTQLDVIRSDLQDTITEAETRVLRVAIGAEQLMESGASRAALTEYFYAQRDKYLSSDDFMNVYIAGRDWHIIPDFDAPDDFHAAEHVWYIGAQDCPGEVYISEPYVDASTGDMCFTVSTLLSDGETVAGMDLNFSKAQESIRRMTQGRDETAMIVTSGGLIAGYTDMSLVGEVADQKLPEYAEILRRVIASGPTTASGWSWTAAPA